MKADRAPDFQGIGKAWRVRLEDVKPRTPQLAAQLRCTVASWIVQGPWHPFWDHWTLYVVSLQDEPGLGPAHRHYEEAEYEFAIWSLQPPDNSRVGIRGDPSVEDLEATGQGLPMLTPADVITQFHGVTRDKAADIARATVQMIIQGGASPDQDWRAWWKVCIENTVRHARGEAHLPAGGEGGGR